MRKYEIKKAIEENNLEELKNIILKDIEEEESKKYFYGFELSKEEIERNRISYSTFAKCFDMVLCNNITEIDPYIWDNIESGSIGYYYINDNYYESEEEKEEAQNELEEKINELEEKMEEEGLTEEEINELEELKSQLEEFENAEEITKDIYQYYILGTSNIYLFQEANELVLYSEKLDCYVWCVDHFGTPWSGVFTNIKIDNSKE